MASTQQPPGPVANPTSSLVVYPTQIDLRSSYTTNNNAQSQAILDHYTIEHKLGEGTYGVVYKTYNQYYDDISALKRIRFESANEGTPSTAIREVAILRHLHHPNIVELFEVAHDETSLSLFFEFLDQDLHDYIETCNAQNTTVSLSTVCSFTYQLISGLLECHKHHIYHRDLKPQNLLINTRGELKLADFGLARCGTIPIKALTHEVVTLWYRPPDVILGNARYDAKIDMWGVGCIFAELFVGRPLFPGNSPLEQLLRIFRVCGGPYHQSNTAWDPSIYSYWSDYERRIRRDNKHVAILHCPPSLHNVIPHLSPDAQSLLSGLLHYNPNDRISASVALQHEYFTQLKTIDLIETEKEEKDRFVLLQAAFDSETKSLQSQRAKSRLTRELAFTQNLINNIAEKLNQEIATDEFYFSQCDMEYTGYLKPQTYYEVEYYNDVSTSINVVPESSSSLPSSDQDSSSSSQQQSPHPCPIYNITHHRMSTPYALVVPPIHLLLAHEDTIDMLFNMFSAHFMPQHIIDKITKRVRQIYSLDPNLVHAVDQQYILAKSLEYDNTVLLDPNSEPISLFPITNNTIRALVMREILFASLSHPLQGHMDRTSTTVQYTFKYNLRAIHEWSTNELAHDDDISTQALPEYNNPHYMGENISSSSHHQEPSPSSLSSLPPYTLISSEQAQSFTLFISRLENVLQYIHATPLQFYNYFKLSQSPNAIYQYTSLKPPQRPPLPVQTPLGPILQTNMGTYDDNLSFNNNMSSSSTHDNNNDNMLINHSTNHNDDQPQSYMMDPSRMSPVRSPTSY